MIMRDHHCKPVPAKWSGVRIGTPWLSRRSVPSTTNVKTTVSVVLYMIWSTRRNAANPWIIDLTRNNTAVMGCKHGLPNRQTSHHNHGKLNAPLVIRGHTYVWSGLGILKIPNVRESFLITCWSSLKCLPSLTRTLIIVSSEKCRLPKFFKGNE